MAVIPVITMPMHIVQKASLLLLIPAVAVFHAAAVYSLLAIKTDWALDIAETISIANPDVYAAQAIRYQATNPEKSLYYWTHAAELKPLWPYYQLGALDSEIRLQASDQAIQTRLQQITDMAPNERGLDKSLFELALLRWDSLTLSQQQSLLERMASANYRSRAFAFDVANKVGKRTVLCANLPWRKVKNFCRAR